MSTKKSNQKKVAKAATIQQPVTEQPVEEQSVNVPPVTELSENEQPATENTVIETLPQKSPAPAQSQVRVLTKDR